MNSKEALERLNKHFNLDCYSFDSDENSKVTEYSIIKQDLERLEQLEKQIKRWYEKYAFVEKELVQTKKNFRNSQTHSKNCYKKLKEKYKKLQKENEKFLVNKNLAQILAVKYKKALDILKEKLDIKLEIHHNGGCTLNHKIISNCVIPNERCLRYLEVEEYELLKEVLDCE